MPKVLLDFDGVLFKNRKVHEIIQRKSIGFVARKMHITPQKAAKINEHHYRTFGHTIMNLPHGTLVDYNREVFNTIDWDFVKNCITDDDRYVMETFFELKCQFPATTHYLFSNATLDYCEKVTNAIGYNLMELVDCNVFTSDIITEKIQNDFVKPLPYTYSYVEDIIASTQQLHFLDDNPLNIAPLKYNSRWNPHLIDRTMKREDIEKIYRSFNVYHQII